jgi:hypothetical protein
LLQGLDPAPAEAIPIESIKIVTAVINIPILRALRVILEIVTRAAAAPTLVRALWVVATSVKFLIALVRL